MTKSLVKCWMCSDQQGPKKYRECRHCDELGFMRLNPVVYGAFNKRVVAPIDEIKERFDKKLETISPELDCQHLKHEFFQFKKFFLKNLIDKYDEYLTQISWYHWAFGGQEFYDDLTNNFLESYEPTKLKHQYAEPRREPRVHHDRQIEMSHFVKEEVDLKPESDDDFVHVDKVEGALDHMLKDFETRILKLVK